MIDQCLEGYNATLFAYGHTGAGKTYTIFGSGETNKGILQLATEYLIEQLKLTKEMWVLSCNFVEIYNEQFRDLLSGTQTNGCTV